MTACIAGWSHSAFGKLQGQDVESLMVTAIRNAMDSASLGADAIDAIFVGHFNNGLSRQDFSASLALQADDALRFKPATRVENACATGTAAINAALDFIAAERGRVALVVGVEKMTDNPGAQIADSLLCAAYRREEGEINGGFAGVFGEIANTYFDRYGDHSATLAAIAARNHRNGVNNPYAQFREDFGFEFCNTVSDRNPRVAGPLRRTDCSPVSDGAAALVICDESLGRAMGRPLIRFRARSQANDFLPMSRRDMTRFLGAERAWQSALASAGMSLDDLSLVETHDCFTIAELIEYEAMGLAAPGQGHRVVSEGWVERDGRLPINPSGGLKSKGHPIGATGVSMHALCAMQLTGQAGDMQIPGAHTAAVFNMGGAAVANYVSILERTV